MSSLRIAIDCADGSMAFMEFPLVIRKSDGSVKVRTGSKKEIAFEIAKVEASWKAALPHRVPFTGWRIVDAEEHLRLHALSRAKAAQKEQ